mmetsp:Transcript_8543/g.16142  ORF Transcript_8543/g.16142 Transcript_8543/m.16142 type:complete len:221 (+) Transcript_8543:56-718(+)
MFQRVAWQTAVLAFFAILHGGDGSGLALHLARLCRGVGPCDANAPVMDYSSDLGKCVCVPHPCWDDAGQMHSCPQESFPYLHFAYSDEGKLECGCSSIPSYNSIYISKNKCPGHKCDKPDFPILDYDDEKGECRCRSHPCWNEGGQRKHECNKPDFPILVYREQAGEMADSARAICECVAKLEHPSGVFSKGGASADASSRTEDANANLDDYEYDPDAEF